MKTRARAWLAGYCVLALICVGLMLYLKPSSKLLQDGDTVLTITEINHQQNPWRWLYHDWPIGNHFYRPIVSELFELDNWLHPHNDYLWGITGDILCVITTVGLFWLLREITDSPLLTTASTVLFYLWQVNAAGFLSRILLICAGGVLAIGFWRQRHRPSIYRLVDRMLSQLVRGKKRGLGGSMRAMLAIVWRVIRINWRTLTIILPPAMVLYWLGMNEIGGFAPLGFRMLAWIPGRTASSMTAFAFISLAAFARYMRLQKRRPVPATALDKPNTRSAEPLPDRKPSAGWPILSTIFLALSLMCYEQAVMVPVILGLIGLVWAARGATGRWWLWGIPFGIVLVTYIVARNIIIPPGHSWYFDWQKRSLNTTFWSLQRYMFFFLPAASGLPFYIFEVPKMWLISFDPWRVVLEVIYSGASFYQMHRRWILTGFAWIGSFVAYGPMAWFKDFEHYHYFPMAFRAFFDVMMIWTAIDLTTTAWSPRARQAPLRLSPAPGSLPHL